MLSLPQLFMTPPIEVERAVVKMPLADHQVPGYFLRPILGLPGARPMPLIKQIFPSGQHLTTVGFPLAPAITRGMHLAVEGFKQISTVLVPANITGNWDDPAVVDRLQTNLMEIGNVLRGPSVPNYPQYLNPACSIYHLLILADLRQDEITTWYDPQAPEGEEMDFFGEANYARLLAELLKGPAHSDGLATLDLHSRRAVKWFEQVQLPHINITALPKFIQWLDSHGYTKDDPNVIIASCDYGDLTRAWELSERTGIPIAALIHKRREDQDLIAALKLGNVRGKKVIIWDDMISSAGTLARDVDLLFQEGAAEVVFMATHPIFAGKYRENIKKIKSHKKYGDKVKIVTSNSLVVGSDRMPIGVERVDIEEIVTETARCLMTYSFPEAKARLQSLGYIHELDSPDDAMIKISRKLNGG